MGWSGDRRRGGDDFEGMFPGGVEVGEVELQRVRVGHDFLGKECVKDFQKLKIFV